MSFVNNREGVFKYRSGKRPMKKMCSSRMRAASSFTDPRSWSLDPRRRMSFIMDAMAETTCSSGGDDAKPKEIFSETDQEDVGDLHRSVKQFSLNRTSYQTNLMFHENDQEIIKLNNKLFEANSKIEDLDLTNKELSNENNARNLEVDNLRDLVTELTKQLEYYEDLKEREIDKLKNKCNVERDLIDAQCENSHLERKLKLYAELQDKHSEVIEAYKALIIEKNDLTKKHNELRAQTLDMHKKLESKDQEVWVLQTQAKSFQEGATEKTVLRERLTSKENRISELSKVVEAQLLKINELDVTIHSLSQCFEDKEDFQNQQINELQTKLEDKANCVKDLEQKLHDTELLVAELETLRDQLRVMNRTLQESVKLYERDMEMYIKLTEELSSTVKGLQFENEEKDKKIEKLEVFPQNPHTMLHFSQLNKLMTTAENIKRLTLEEQNELLESIKRVIIKLKEEMWGDNITPTELEIRDIHIQTDYGGHDVDVQCVQSVQSAFVQTAFPDEYLEKFQAGQRNINHLNSKITTLDDIVRTQANELDSLETNLFDSIQENHKKDMKIEVLEVNHILLQKQVINLMHELKQMHVLLKTAGDEVAQNCQIYSHAIHKLESALSTTLNEYSSYYNTFDVYTDRSTNKIAELSDLIRSQKVKNEDQGLQMKLILETVKEKADEERFRDLKCVEDKLKKQVNLNKLLKRNLRRNADKYKRDRFRLFKITAHKRKMHQANILLKDQLSRAEETKMKSIESGQCLSSENDILINERSVLLQEIFNLKNKLSKAEKCVDKYNEQQLNQEEMKMKMEKFILKLMKKLTKYKKLANLNDLKENINTRASEWSVMSDTLNYEIELLKTENMSLSTTICSLKQKLSSLLELPQKECSSVELQVIPDEKEDILLEEIRTHYEQIIDNMKKERDAAADQAHKQYMKNLRVLRETHERDVRILKTSHCEKLDKLRNTHEEETKRHYEEKMVQLNDEKIKIEHTYEQQITDLKLKYERMKREVEESYTQEKEFLLQQLSNCNSELSKQQSESLEAIDKIKANFENWKEKLLEMQRIEREQIMQQFEQLMETQKKSRNKLLSDKQIQCRIVHKKEQGTNPELSLTQREASCNTTSFSYCQEITNINHEGRISCEFERNSEQMISITSSPTIGKKNVLLSAEREMLLLRINELENDVITQHSEYLKKLKLCDKRIKHEQMKAKEIASILDQELKYSTDVHCRLGLQYNRAEQLEIDKATLVSQLNLYEQEMTLLNNLTKDENLEMTVKNREIVGNCSNELNEVLKNLQEKIDQAATCENYILKEKKDSILSGELNHGKLFHNKFGKVKEQIEDNYDSHVFVMHQCKLTKSWTPQFPM